MRTQRFCMDSMSGEAGLLPKPSRATGRTAQPETHRKACAAAGEKIDLRPRRTRIADATSSTTRERLRFALSARADSSSGRDTPAAANQLDDAGNASLGGVSPTVEESVSSHRPRGSHAFRCVSGYAVRRVARDGRSSTPVSPARRRVRWALSAHGHVTRDVSRGGHLSAACRRRSRSPCLRTATRIARLPMRFRLRSASRRSRWFAAAACLACCEGDRHGAKCDAEPFPRRRAGSRSRLSPGRR